MNFEGDLATARELSIIELTSSIQRIGFECTRCGACCRHETSTDPANGDHDHTATVFPDEIRAIQEAHGYDWRDVARPIPYGLTDGEDGPEGETLEWALDVDECGDCRFYAGTDDNGLCSIHQDRPLICQTYPFTVALNETAGAMGAVVERDGDVRAHECPGLGGDISTEAARSLAETLLTRTIRELDEAIALRDNYTVVDTEPGAVVVHDSEGPKHPDGTPVAR